MFSGSARWCPSSVNQWGDVITFSLFENLENNIRITSIFN